MSRHDPIVCLRQMLDHAREAVNLLAGMSEKDLADNRTIQLAVTRLIEIIGEAANRTPHAFRDQHPDLPWKQAIGMRHVMAHGYDIIEYEVIWDTVVNSLPQLIRQLQTTLGE